MGAALDRVFNLTANQIDLAEEHIHCRPVDLAMPAMYGSIEADGAPSGAPQPSTIRKYAGAVLVCLGLTAIITNHRSNESPSSSGPLTAQLPVEPLEVEAGPRLQESVKIGYTDRYQTEYFANYSFMVEHDYDAIVAAHQMTKMTLYHDKVDHKCSDCYFSWSIDGAAYPEFKDSTMEYTFTDIRPYVIRSVHYMNGATIDKTSRVVCRYIRREIRALEDDDRDAYFEAVRTVYSTLKEEGRSLYGPDYQDAGYFINYHTWMAGTKACDHLHDGMGFLTGHNAITNEFEQNLQRIDPSVSIPYWDYTIDMHHVLGADKKFSVFYQSPVFMEDWFGPMGDPDDNYQVTSSFVADIGLDPAEWDLSDSDVIVSNAYGLLRSPWNVANVPGVIRSNATFGYYSSYNSAPRCAEFYTAMNYSDVLTFTKFAQANAHGAIHTFIGGVENANWHSFFDLKGFTIFGEAVGLQGFGVVKDMWRSVRYPSCPPLFAPSHHFPGRC